MKVNKTSEACGKFNVMNADSIAAGLMEAWEPDDAMVRQELASKARASSEEAFKKLAGQFWLLVINALSADDAKIFKVPQTTAFLEYHLDDKLVDTKANVYFKTRGEVEAYNPYGRFSSLGTPKLRIVIGEYGDAEKRKSILPYKPNDIVKLSTDTEFAAKVATRVATKIQANRQRYLSNISRESYAKKVAGVYEANKAFFNSIGNYGSDISVDTDGSITVSLQIKGDIARLKEVVELVKKPLTKV